MIVVIPRFLDANLGGIWREWVLRTNTEKFGQKSGLFSGYFGVRLWRVNLSNGCTVAEI